MLNFNNTHIFTGYLKQLLASINIPTCKIYTKGYANYLNTYGQEDPRIIESIDTQNANRLATRVNYLKDNDIVSYVWNNPTSEVYEKPKWIESSKNLFMGNNPVKGLTRTLKNNSNIYDTKTHNYLGDFLRFLRDYHDVDLMSLYNCFDNKIYNNIYLRVPRKEEARYFLDTEDNRIKHRIKVLPNIEVNSNNPNYRVYAIPVKLFANYTIAIDSPQEIELFCGIYGTRLDASEKGVDLIRKTYIKLQKTSFNRPFLYDGLDVKYWNRELESREVLLNSGKSIKYFQQENKMTRWDIINREQDLKLFIKVPAACKSSIVVLEGDYRNFNDNIFTPTFAIINDKETTVWKYKQNTYKQNFQKNYEKTQYIDPETGKETNSILECRLPDLNDRPFKPISKLQLLMLNTGESYPFADRLIEYLTGSAITPVEEIHDNIKRVQKVMRQNGYSFNIDGLWEPKIRKIAYDYVMNTGPVETKTINNEKVLVDTHRGLHPKLGHTRKDSLMDILGYVDKDVEKWYATWKLLPVIKRGQADPNELASTPADIIKDTDIYKGLYNI